MILNDKFHVGTIGQRRGVSIDVADELDLVVEVDWVGPIEAVRAQCEIMISAGSPSCRHGQPDAR